MISPVVEPRAQNGHRRRRRRGKSDDARVLPHDLEAERLVLGGLMSEPHRLEALKLEPKDFHHPMHAVMVRVLADLAREGVPPLPGTVRQAFEEAGEQRLLNALPPLYLDTLFTDYGVGSAALEQHARRIAGLARVRELGEIYSTFAESVYDVTDPEAWLAETRIAMRDVDLPAAPAPGQVRALPTIRIGKIPNPGAPKWLVDTLWTEGAFGFVGAEPKAWKSFLTLEVAICVAAGRKVFGKYDVKQGRVLLFTAEGGKGLARYRAGMMCVAHGLNIDDLDLEIIDVDTLHIDDPEKAAALLATVEARRPALLVLDPLREMHVGDENDAAVIAGLLGPLRTMQARFQCAVMLVHHMAKMGLETKSRRGGQRLRGSSALHGATDSALYLLTSGEGAEKRIRVTPEHRGMAEPEPFSLALREKDTPEGKALWLELVEVEDNQEEIALATREKALAKIQRAIFLAAMPGRTPLGSTRAICLAVKMSAKTVGPVLADLMESGQITRDAKKNFRPVTGGDDD